LTFDIGAFAKLSGILSKSLYKVCPYQFISRVIRPYLIGGEKNLQVPKIPISFGPFVGAQKRPQRCGGAGCFHIGDE